MVNGVVAGRRTEGSGDCSAGSFMNRPVNAIVSSRQSRGGTSSGGSKLLTARAAKAVRILRESVRRRFPSGGFWVIVSCKRRGS